MYQNQKWSDLSSISHFNGLIVYVRNKYLSSFPTFDTGANGNEAIIVVANRRPMHVVEFLHTSPDGDPAAGDNSVFVATAYNGDLDVLKRLISDIFLV